MSFCAFQIGCETDCISFDLRPSDAINIAVRCKVTETVSCLLFLVESSDSGQVPLCVAERIVEIFQLVCGVELLKYLDVFSNIRHLAIDAGPNSSEQVSCLQ